MLHLEKPLVAQARLGHGVLIALRVSHLVLILLDFLDETCLLQIFGYLLAAGKAVHAHIHAGGLADGGVVVEYVNSLQAMLLAQHIVVHVVGRSHLQTACAEVDVHISILDYGDLAAYQGHDYLLAAQMLVFRVLGVDTHRRVAHDGLGTGSCHDGITLLADNLVAQIVELGVLLLVHNLDVRQSRLGLGIPVDHTLAAIYQALAVKVDKHVYHALGADLVHGESGAVPVTRRAKFLELLQDNTAMLLFPLPGMLEKLLAREVALLDALGGQLVDHLGLGSDGRMVGAGHPQRVFAHQTGTAYEYILDSIVEHMPHMEYTCDVRRGNHYSERLAGVRLGVKQFMVHPIGIPSILHCAGIIL